MSKAPSVRSVPGALMSTAQQGEVSKERGRKTAKLWLYQRKRKQDLNKMMC